MREKIGVWLLLFLAVLGSLILLGGILLPPTIQRTARRAYPQIAGDIQVDGLQHAVDIHRDPYGVPHIYAQSQHDLFFAQGLVHAQDRFWQMDMWRHQGAGRLSELLGGSTLETDKFLRTLGWERVSRTELELLDEEERAVLEAYSAGVNAYIKKRTGQELGLEYTFLPLLNRGYQPPPWTPLNSLTWSKAMAWDLRGNLDTEIDRALLLRDLSRTELEMLYPPYPEDHPIILSGSSASSTPHDHHPPSSEIDNLYTANSETSVNHLMVNLRNELRGMTLSGSRAPGTGSNSWVVSGALTDTGLPYLANDPHLSQQIPSIWYEVGLHCRPKTEACRLDIVGFSFAGVPGVIIGHNQRIAWGFTNVGPDVMDLYIEKINPENPDQYLYQGKWLEMEHITEEIQVAGGETVTLDVRKTRHGPIIGDVYGLEEFGEESGLDLPRHYALALKWTALQPSCIFCAVWDFNTAQNWEDFRHAAREFAVPAQNLVYADVEGNIAYQMPGKIPIRAAGHDGMLPVPGWSGEYDWQGYIPFADLPSMINPERGYILTANNPVMGDEYPYLITRRWAYGYRAQRIQNMIETAPRPITMEAVLDMQGDEYDLLAADMVPLLLSLELHDRGLAEARDLLSRWDFQTDMESAPAALYMATWNHLLKETFQDNLPPDFSMGAGSTAKEVTRRLLMDGDHPWWDNTRTRQTETRDDILHRALTGAYKELKRTQGSDPSAWSWGEMHTITFTHQVMNDIPLIRSAFNRGPYPTGGGNAIVNATAWNANDPYKVSGLPSMRMVVDLSDLSNAWTINTTGQSGHPYHPHYVDKVPAWRQVQHHPMLWDRASIKQQAEGTLRLVP